MRATQARIHLSAFRRNLAEIKKQLADRTKLCVPVKADAYGHGAVRCALTAVECGADFLGVASVSEGAELRQSGITASILLFSQTMPDEIAAIIENDLTPFVYSPEFIAHLDAESRRNNKKCAVHLKIDSGMGRAGCRPNEAVNIARQISNAEHLDLQGVCTHFSVADSFAPENISYTQQQFDVFCRAVDTIRNAGIDPGIRHCANSAATILYPHMHLDMVRPGILCYGYFPDNELKTKYAAKMPLRPVMELISGILAVKPLTCGESVSYGRQWTSTDDCRIAVIPAGYGDGLLRTLSPGLRVAINKRAHAVVGRICMDQCMVLLDVSGSEHWGDEVIIFGDKERNAIMDAADLANLAGTIPYEILCGISKRVPRVDYEHKNAAASFSPPKPA